MTKIKICGITNLKDALLAIEMGADALGFIFATSPRQISPEKARGIISDLPPFICKVGIFKDENISTVKGIMDYCFLDLVQLHGKEEIPYLKAFGQKAIKVFQINQKEVLNEIRKYSLAFFMLDIPKESNETHYDLRVAQEAKKYGKVILAGGLSTENIERALQMVSPYGVDVCRGVEKEEGLKNPEKLRQFILKVRKWDIQRT